MDHIKDIDSTLVNRHLELLKDAGHELPYISGEEAVSHTRNMDGHIENFIGYAQVPIGVAGPLQVNGRHAQGAFHVPLATTEGALVASYNRGMKAAKLCGGITSICVEEGVQRSPFFKFETLRVALEFVKWAETQFDTFVEVASTTSRFAKLQKITYLVEGNAIIASMQFYTGDAAGQNMVTIASAGICQYILKTYPIKPIDWYIGSNFAGDKKATANALTKVRGKKVVSEVVIKKEVAEQVLHSSPEMIVRCWQVSTLSNVQSGTIGAQAHVANGLTAIYLACGQDVACVSESAIGLTRMEVTAEGDLYCSLTLPGIIVGTVGGGTALSTQKEALELLDCFGAGKANKFAEICGAVALAGEISIAAAMSAHHFTRAHRTLGRK